MPESTPHALLKFQIGPVQEFIAQARSTRDLWSGSFLISWMMAKTSSAGIPPWKRSGRHNWRVAQDYGRLPLVLRRPQMFDSGRGSLDHSTGFVPGADVTLTGPGPVWLYLRLAHTLHGICRSLTYDSPVSGPVVVFNHDPY